LLEVLFEKLLGYKADFDTLAPARALDVAVALPSPEQRHGLVELMVLMELVCRPIPAPLRESVERWAAELGVDDNGLLLVIGRPWLTVPQAAWARRCMASIKSEDSACPVWLALATRPWPSTIGSM